MCYRKNKYSKYRELIVDYFADGQNRCPGYGDGSQTIRPDAISKLYSYYIVKNYREAYGLFATNGILFNHESTI